MVKKIFVLYIIPWNFTTDSNLTSGPVPRAKAKTVVNASAS
jgi:hypothetical protein